MSQYVVVLLGLPGAEIRQLFGPYGTEALAESAKEELSGWPTLHGLWEVRPLTRHGDSQPAPPTPPALPYVPPHTHPAPNIPNLWPAPVWPWQDRIAWCDTSANPGMTLTLQHGVNCELDIRDARVANEAWTLNRIREETQKRRDDDGTAGVPARV